MEKILIALLLLVGLVNIAPLAGVLGADKLSALYGISFADGNLAILMRHRAVLFGLIGGCILLSAFTPALRPYAIAAGFVSMLSFVALALASGDYNPQLRKIVIADSAASFALALALIIYLTRRGA
ncbi:MAG: phosphopantetheine adenylyltransferase [Nevskiales bacterium]